MALLAKQVNKEILMIIYDLSSAYDLANHKILISKLKVYGFGLNALKWVESYLKNCKQFGSVSEKMSKTLYKNTKVPQGSRLSPLLFTCLNLTHLLSSKQSYKITLMQREEPIIFNINKII